MTSQRLVECSFLIPVRRDRSLSDGQAHERKTWRWLETALYQFGGASRALELYQGWYLDRKTSKRVSDKSRKYVVAVPETELALLRAILRDACVAFHQRCIYLSVAGDVELVERGGDDTL